MSKKNEVDPFVITDDEIKDAQSAVSFGSSGKICPKRNKSIDKPCKVCDYIQTQIYAMKYGENHPARKWAKDKRAKLTWFLNVVLPENPDKAIFLEVGEKAGNQIISGMKEDGWTDIVHPHKGKGRELKISKKKAKGENWPTYTVNAVLKKADWEVPEEVWKSVPDLRNMIEILETTEMTEENYMHIKSLKNGGSLVFRMLPPAEVEVGEKKCVIAPVFRHWGVTDGQISGEDSLNWDTGKKDASEKVDAASDDGDLDLDFQKEETLKEAPKEEKSNREPPPCYEQVEFFDKTDEKNCVPCPWFKPCGKSVMIKGG